MQDKLVLIFQNVNDWVKYAESKNAALLAFNSAIIFGILRLTQDHDFGRYGIYYICFVIITLIISIMCCLIPFLATYKQAEWIVGKRSPKEDDNLIFYGHIANYSAETYLKALYAQQNINLVDILSSEEDYAKQIITNSRIALWKFKWFNFALWLVISAIVTPVIARILFVILNNKSRN